MKTVYYGINENIFGEDPQPLLQYFSNDVKKINSQDFQLIKKCPAFKESCNNVFVITSPIDYDLNWKEKQITSSLKDQNFFNNYVLARDVQEGMLSYKFPFYMFWCDQSLEIEQLPPYLSDVDIMKKTIVVPGRYDIGQHFRGLELALKIKNENEKVIINRDEPLFYIKFHTKEKIIFKKFYTNPEFISFTEAPLKIRDGIRPRPLQFWYNLFNKSYRKKVSKMIKSNLL